MIHTIAIMIKLLLKKRFRSKCLQDPAKGKLGFKANINESSRQKYNFNSSHLNEKLKITKI